MRCLLFIVGFWGWFCDVCLAGFNCGDNVVEHELDAFDCVVVTWDDVRDVGRVGVGVDEGDDGDVEDLGFFDGVAVDDRVGDEEDARFALEFFDAAVAGVEEVDFLLEALDFEFTVAVFEFAGIHATLEGVEFFDLGVDGFDVCECAADPALGDVRLADRFGGNFYDVFELFFSANEEDFLSFCDGVGDDREGCV